MIDLRVKELSFLQAVQLWKDYAEAVGQDTLHAAYGSHWPRFPVHGERIYEFCIPTCGTIGERVGWASLIYEPTERVTWHSHGIFPAYQKLKLTYPLTHISKGFGFSETPCLAVGAKILDTNTSYQAWMREHHVERGWKAAGRVTLPEGYDVYVILREDWYKAN